MTTNLTLRDEEKPDYQTMWKQAIENCQAMMDERDTATAALAKAEGERDRLATALEPFALVAETEIGGAEDDRDWFTTTALKLKVGHFRRALAALTLVPEAPKDGE